MAPPHIGMTAFRRRQYRRPAAADNDMTLTGNEAKIRLKNPPARNVKRPSGLSMAIALLGRGRQLGGAPCRNCRAYLAEMKSPAICRRGVIVAVAGAIAEGACRESGRGRNLRAMPGGDDQATKLKAHRPSGKPASRARSVKPRPYETLRSRPARENDVDIENNRASKWRAGFGGERRQGNRSKRRLAAAVMLALCEKLASGHAAPPVEAVIGGRADNNDNDKTCLAVSIRAIFTAEPLPE